MEFFNNILPLNNSFERCLWKENNYFFDEKCIFGAKILIFGEIFYIKTKVFESIFFQNLYQFLKNQFIANQKCDNFV
jgi:hypothetical protein